MRGPGMPQKAETNAGPPDKRITSADYHPRLLNQGFPHSEVLFAIPAPAHQEATQHTHIHMYSQSLAAADAAAKCARGSKEAVKI